MAARCGDGAGIDPAAHHRLEAEHGPRRVLSERAGEAPRQAATGLACLALAAPTSRRRPPTLSLRLPMRAVLLTTSAGAVSPPGTCSARWHRLAPAPGD